MAKKRSASSESAVTGAGAIPAREHRRRERVSPNLATPSPDDTATAAPQATETGMWDSAAAGLNAGAATPERTPEYHEIAILAYSYWEARGCPNGSPEVDWLRAEQELLAHRGTYAKA